MDLLNFEGINDKISEISSLFPLDTSVTWVK